MGCCTSTPPETKPTQNTETIGGDAEHLVNKSPRNNDVAGHQSNHIIAADDTDDEPPTYNHTKETQKEIKPKQKQETNIAGSHVPHKIAKNLTIEQRIQKSHENFDKYIETPTTTNIINKQIDDENATNLETEEATKDIIDTNTNNDIENDIKPINNKELITLT
eukprot:290052_1